MAQKRHPASTEIKDIVDGLGAILFPVNSTFPRK